MPGAPRDDTTQFHDFLCAFLREHSAFLKQILRVYVLRMGLVNGENVSVMVDEVFQDTILQIMTHGERFMSVQEPRAWFLAVAGNLLKRRRTSLLRRERFEVLTGDLAASFPIPNEAELADEPGGTFAEGPEEILVAREQAKELLALVSPADARVLSLSILHDLGSTGHQSERHARASPSRPPTFAPGMVAARTSAAGGERIGALTVCYDERPANIGGSITIGNTSILLILCAG